MFKLNDRVQITEGYEHGRTGTVVGRAPSGALWVDVDGIGRVRLSPAVLTLTSNR